MNKIGVSTKTSTKERILMKRSGFCNGRVISTMNVIIGMERKTKGIPTQCSMANSKSLSQSTIKRYRYASAAARTIQNNNTRINRLKLERAIRILKLAKRPDRSEVFLVIKITVAGMAILGLIAYVIRFVLAALLQQEL